MRKLKELKLRAPDHYQVGNVSPVSPYAAFASARDDNSSAGRSVTPVSPYGSPVFATAQSNYSTNGGYGVLPTTGEIKPQSSAGYATLPS